MEAIFDVLKRDTGMTFTGYEMLQVIHRSILLDGYHVPPPTRQAGYTEATLFDQFPMARRRR